MRIVSTIVALCVAHVNGRRTMGLTGTRQRRLGMMQMCLKRTKAPSSAGNSVCERLDCKFRGGISFTGKVTNDPDIGVGVDIIYIINQVAGTITVNMHYNYSGYLGFGVNENPSMMVGSYAVIGLPNITHPNEATVLKYKLTSKSASPLPLPEANQTLMDTLIYQDKRGTTMQFTKYLTEEGETPISATSLNNFVYAAAGIFGNQLRYHGGPPSSWILAGHSAEVSYCSCGIIRNRSNKG